MAKFCTQCGRPLTEGEVCNCQLHKNVEVNARDVESNNVNMGYERVELNKAESERAGQRNVEFNKVESERVEQERAGFNKADARETIETIKVVAGEATEGIVKNAPNYFKMLWDNLTGIIKSPATYSSKFIEKEDTKATWGIIGVYAIVQAIFVLCILQKINKMVGFVGGFFGSYLNDVDLGEYGQSAQEMLKVPVVKGFLLTVIIALLLSVLYAGILFVASKLMKEDCSFQKMLSVTAVRNTSCIATTVIAIILFILNPTVGIIVFFFGEFLSICFTMSVMIREVSANKSAYIVGLTVLVFTIISMFIVSKFIPLYFPTALREGLNQLEPYLQNPSMLLKELAGEFY